VFLVFLGFWGLWFSFVFGVVLGLLSCGFYFLGVIGGWGGGFFFFFGLVVFVCGVGGFLDFLFFSGGSLRGNLK